MPAILKLIKMQIDEAAKVGGKKMEDEDEDKR